ncbi:HU domain-containing protein [Pontibacter oryzae]|uniref:SPOR domain-containing protein n=1 Tax=Pontibacter oryzae TaxID=2304593 RepID=A0A399SG60_9BACT|nr:SPOR domain-containing protein [Pontibacter oryzae]RIJ41533.1 SPOR domain-containing protein [Pontibacter oryzae]
MVEKHIKSLLYDHDCVIIPEFGGLIARYVPARINPVKHTLAPPSKKIAFNEKLILNDGLLISTIAHYNDITKEEAHRRVAEFVHQAKSKLHHYNRFELSDIGVFRYNAERRLVFEYVEADNMLEASFGLPELIARPVRVEEPAVLRTLIKERQQELAEEKQPLRRRIKRAYHMAAGLALAGLSVSALYFLSLQADYNLSSLNPMALFANGYSSSAHIMPNRYDVNYVPFTEDERQQAYSAILPVAGADGSGLSEEFTTDESVDDSVAVSESIATAGSDEWLAAEQVIEEPEAAKEIVESKIPAHIINNRDGRSYIISGGYARLENAEMSREQFKEKGHQVKILTPYPGSRLFRVAVADFNSPAEAQEALDTYRKKFGDTLWVLNN